MDQSISIWKKDVVGRDGKLLDDPAQTGLSKNP